MKRKFSMTIHRGAEGETVSVPGYNQTRPLDFEMRQLIVKTFATVTRQPISKGKPKRTA